MKDNSFYKRIGAVALVVAGISATFGGAVTQIKAATGPLFNKHAQDDPTISGRVHGSNAPLSTTINAQTGNVVVLNVWVHNSADPNVTGQNSNTAYNTRVKVTLPTEYGLSHAATAKVSADNATTADRFAVGAATVNVTNGVASRLEYIPGSATLLRWDANSGQFVETNFPDNTQRDKIVTDPNGYVIIPEQRSCWQYVHVVRLQVRVVGGTPNLEVLKQVSNGLGAQFVQSTTAIPSDRIQYQIEVKNTGTDTARDLKISDTLDSRHTYVAGTSKKRFRDAQGQIVEQPLADPTLVSGVYTWSLGDLAAVPSGNVFITFMTQLKDENSFSIGPNTIENCATTVASNASQKTTALCTTVVVTRNGSVTFQVSKEVQRVGDTQWYGDALTAAVAPGQRVRYRITAMNQGNINADNVVLKDVLPAGVTYGGNAQRWYEGGATSIDASSLVTTNGLNIGTLKPGNTEAIAVIFEALVPEACSQSAMLTDRAELWFTGTKRAEDTAAVSLTCQVGISVVKDIRVAGGTYADSVSGFVREGQQLDYRIIAGNAGNGQVTDLYVRDSLPNYVQYIPGSLQIDGVFVTDENVVNSFFGQNGMKLNSFVTPGETYTIQFSTRVVDCPVLGRIDLVNTAFARALTLTEISDTASAVLEVRAPHL